VAGLDQAVAEIEANLEAVARADGTISYSELSPQIEAVPLTPNDPLLFALLDVVSKSSHAEHGVMLSAVVTHAGDDHLPGKGFFWLARQLGHEFGKDPLAKLEFHTRELLAVYRAYGLGD
jgi:hypothetical protein